MLVSEDANGSQLLDIISSLFYVMVVESWFSRLAVLELQPANYHA